MVFSTASEVKRPVRLQKATREWAYASLYGKYGDDTMKTAYVDLDDIEGFEGLSVTEKYNRAIRRIAEKAPIRICSEEKICGAATLGDAIRHLVPARYKGQNPFYSVSHLTIRYDKVLKQGLNAYAEDIAKRLKDTSLSEEEILFLHSLENVIESIRIWHHRYLTATENRRPDLHRLLHQVPFSPARNFHEALQSLWFIFAFVRLCGNWPGIGRLDWLLGDFLEKDLLNGLLTENEARELLASFFIKGCEWIRSDPPVGTGDAQHYQNIVLAGINADGNEITNQVTFLVLDIVEELAISDFPITVRLNKNTSYALKEKTAQVMRHGGGIVAIYNEDLILRSLKKLGYADEEARCFANDGCWEVQIPGKTNFAYMPFDALQIWNKVTGITADKIPEYNSIEELYSAFRDALYEAVESLYSSHVKSAYICQNGVWQARGGIGSDSVVSLFEDGCIEHARAYYDCGPEYTVRSPHIGGAPDVANSLYAVEKLVFEENKVSFSELVQILKNNWQDNELLRLYAKNKFVYYGNDSDEADLWHTRLLNDFADMVNSFNEKSNCPVKFIPGVSTFGRQVDWLPNRCATAFGYRKGDILSGNDSPVPGTDTQGATAIVKSYCKTDLTKMSCGAALDIKIFPDSLTGDNGISALIALMDGFLALSGFFMQLDAVDTQTLLEAQKDPQKFKTLSVRVSGWNARFVTLNREWQNMIIERNAQNWN